MSNIVSDLDQVVKSYGKQQTTGKKRVDGKEHVCEMVPCMLHADRNERKCLRTGRLQATGNDTNSGWLHNARVCIHEHPALSENLMWAPISESPGARARRGVVVGAKRCVALSLFPVSAITT